MVDQENEEGERMLPVAIVGRIMKKVLPGNAKISKEAKETMQESATEFISFVTAEASDKCHHENRKTVNGDDICWALTSLGFDNYAEVIVRFLHKYREAERDRANHQIKITSSSSPSASASPSAVSKQNKDANFDQISNTQNQKSVPTELEFRVLEKGTSSSFINDS
ncbi:nuclear transcription factor Y subunit B-4 [Euphorbia lathyris]|uniref:nuclear transcription factor Y subunit B-4 n=1 Tax=Euphorbia lathyris TaxID=212925 RepID=UPI003313B5DE